MAKLTVLRLTHFLTVSLFFIALFIIIVVSQLNVTISVFIKFKGLMLHSNSIHWTTCAEGPQHGIEMSSL